MTEKLELTRLSHYEAKAMCMYIEVQNDGFLYHDPEKIKVEAFKRIPDQTYSMTISSPDNFGTAMFQKELAGVRRVGHSLLDPEKERVSTTRRTRGRSPL
jgi:hypothetical protein